MLPEYLKGPFVRMPEFGPGQWLNSPWPITKNRLFGNVVLIDFWDFSCINCLRTLPYLRKWHERYSHLGLNIIGVHAPEFEFGRAQSHIEEALERLQLQYPILLDNDMKTWDLFAVHAWPTKYLVDANGYIRFMRRGEGYYAEFEMALRTLLEERDPSIMLPDPLPPLRKEDRSGAVCFRPTPELYAGYGGGGLFAGGMGNPEGYVTDSVMAYQLPMPDRRSEGHFYLSGFWRSGPESISFAGRDGGRVVIPYRAVKVNAVLSPTPDPVELLLNVGYDKTQSIVEIRQDGRFLDQSMVGADVAIDEQGISKLTINRPGLYRLVNNVSFEAHELELVFRASGLTLYTLTFETCLFEGIQDDNSETYRVP